MLAKIALAALASASMISGALAWDGARAYHLRPAGTNDVSLTGTYIYGEDPTKELDVSVLTPAYRQSIDVGGNAGGLLIGLPLGNVSLDMGGVVETGIVPGDLFIGAGLGLIGSPSLSPMDYAQYKPGFRMGVAGRLFLPTGDYEEYRTANLGQNRLWLEASLPMSYVLGDSMIDPNLMTFEIRPVAVIFGDNDAFMGTEMSQAPVFGVEGHITRNFGNALWAGIDAYYEIGGERTVGGYALGDELETLAVGATLGVSLTPQIAVRASYSTLVYSNVPDATGGSFELATAFLF